uniref:HEAT repeat-containing protein n=1 Tax=Heterorhabditis bacteriophora TaxID=37862 RepID=A0A1I7XN24_HETBA
MLFETRLFRPCSAWLKWEATEWMIGEWKSPREISVLSLSSIELLQAAVSIFGELPRLFGERFTELKIFQTVLLDDNSIYYNQLALINLVYLGNKKCGADVCSSLFHTCCIFVMTPIGVCGKQWARYSWKWLVTHRGHLAALCLLKDTLNCYTILLDGYATLLFKNWVLSLQHLLILILLDYKSRMDRFIYTIISLCSTIVYYDIAILSVLNGLQNMLASWNSGQKNSTIHSAPPSVIEDEEGPSMSIAAKCNSSDDLSKIGLDSTDNDRVYEDNDENMELDTTQVVEDEEHIVEEESLRKGMANKSDAKYQSISESFSQLSYWSTDYDAFSIDDEELMTFGSSDTILQATNFLERRFDVLYVSPENKLSQTSPIISPRKSRNMTRSNRSEGSEEDTTLNEEREEMKMDDTSDLFKDCRGIDEEDEIEGRTEYRDIQKIVPQELVDNFMSMVLPGGVCDSDINRHCAHNFPAVAYTLGRANWPQLKDTYNRLASDDQWRVRVSIANSIHEMAAIVGSQSTDNDLLPVFNAFREDVPEVRAGVLKHLFEFYKACLSLLLLYIIVTECLTPSTRKAMIDILPQFMPMDNSMLHGNWRFRLEFARQCNKLCDIYGVEEINRTMSAIALTLANDRVAEVRKEAVLLLSQILARLVDHEWAETDLFVQDLVNGFAKTQKWTRRQTFAFVCERVLIDHSLSIEQFRYFLLSHLSAMACDNVANVRIAVCRALSLCDPSLYSPPLHFEITPPVGDVLSRLMDDDDMDVARSARVACGKQLTREIVDITLRGLRIREKEETLLETRMIDNYEEVDMSMSPNKSSEA